MKHSDDGTCIEALMSIGGFREPLRRGNGLFLFGVKGIVRIELEISPFFFAGEGKDGKGKIDFKISQ